MTAQGRMLVSKERDRYAPIDADRVRRGAFYTEHNAWLTDAVRAFIHASNPATLVDPFAGAGHLLEHTGAIHPDAERIGYDLHPAGVATQNDSLLAIPRCDDALIVTNPPYLARHSAARKRVLNDVAHYYDGAGRRDLYQVALDRCLDAAPHVVAIVPETIINADYPRDRLHSITILEARAFNDTDCPVVVACFGPESLQRGPVVFRDDEPLGLLQDLESARLTPTKELPMRFNDPDGPVALQAVDTHDPDRPIRFSRREAHAYDTRGIKHSSRLITFISLPTIPDNQLDAVLDRANALLADLRLASQDVILSPFKGNRRDGRRRRRLDYQTARALLELAARNLLHGPRV